MKGKRVIFSIGLMLCLVGMGNGVPLVDPDTYWADYDCSIFWPHYFSEGWVDNPAKTYDIKEDFLIGFYELPEDFVNAWLPPDYLDSYFVVLDTLSTVEPEGKVYNINPPQNNIKGKSFKVKSTDEPYFDDFGQYLISIGAAPGTPFYENAMDIYDKYFNSNILSMKKLFSYNISPNIPSAVNQGWCVEMPKPIIKEAPWEYYDGVRRVRTLKVLSGGKLAGYPESQNLISGGGSIFLDNIIRLNYLINQYKIDKLLSLYGEEIPWQIMQRVIWKLTWSGTVSEDGFVGANIPNRFGFMSSEWFSDENTQKAEDIISLLPKEDYLKINLRIIFLNYVGILIDIKDQNDHQTPMEVITSESFAFLRWLGVLDCPTCLP